jgi:hypothetical protein
MKEVDEQQHCWCMSVMERNEESRDLKDAGCR